MFSDDKRVPEFVYKFHEGRHEYKDIHDRIIPSVTQVGGELHNIPFLESRIGKKVYEYKYMPESKAILNASVLDTASTRGTRIHEGIEEYVKQRMQKQNILDKKLAGFTEEEMGSYKKAIGALEGFEKKHGAIEFLGTEMKLGGMTPHGKLAGMTDIVAKINNELTIIDFKSTSELPKTIGEQTAIYGHMLKQTYGLDPNTVIKRAALWSSVDTGKEAHFIHENDKGAGRIFKSYDEDLENYFKKHGSYAATGHAPEATEATVRSAIREELAWKSREGTGSMYFGTFRDWKKKSLFTMSEFEGTLDATRNEDKAWGLWKSEAENLGLEISPALTSKKGGGVNLYVNPKKGMTSAQTETLRDLRYQAAKTVGREAGEGIKNEFFFLKRAGVSPLDSMGGSLLRSFAHNENFYPAMAVGAGIGALVAGAGAVLGDDRKKLNTYDEPSGIGTKIAVGAALGAIAGPVIKAVASDSGPFRGNLGFNRLTEYTKNALKAVPGIHIR
jgi:hypothetical protein